MKKILCGFSVIVLFSLLVLSCFFLPAVTARLNLRKALYFDKLANNNVQCRLCPRTCFIAEGKRGFCGVRQNQGGELYTLVYARPVSLHIDPIEKKPFFHFIPDSKAFSIATAGCNLRCKFCQNWQISQKLPEEVDAIDLTPDQLIQKVKEAGISTIAYTYTEPTVFYEYMIETARLAKENGIKNVMHSSGYINEAPLRNLAKYLDAANIDLKGFSDEFYSSITQGTLQPVLNSLKILKEEGVHIEITNLVLSGYNDNETLLKEMCLWIKDNLGENTPVHFSRAYPMHKLVSIIPTPVQTLEKIRGIALDSGLRYVYIGNVPGHPAENTYCPKCKQLLIKRSGYIVEENHVRDGQCEYCKEPIPGIWK